MGICQTCFDDKTSEEAVYMRLFPFTLKDKAKHWLDALHPNSINNWLELQAEFMKKILSSPQDSGVDAASYELCSDDE